MKIFFNKNITYFVEPEEIWKPLADIYNTDKGINVRVEIAGVEPKDVRIIIEGKDLIIQGIRKPPTADEKINHFQQIEIPYGQFRIVFQLPSVVDSKKASAKYKCGFLDIALPYSENKMESPIIIGIEEWNE